MPPEQVEVIPEKNRIIRGYKWTTPDGKEDFYPADQVFHIATRNPDSIYRGLGFLPRLREQIMMDRSLRQYKLSQIRNGIPTQIVFKIKRGFAKEEDFQRFQDEMWRRLRGPQNAGKPIALREGDVDLTVVPRPTENETAILANLKYTRNEIAMLFGVPPSRLSDYSEAFRANASEQARTFIQDTIMSWHALVIDALNHKFLPRYFGPEQRRKKLEFAYDYSGVRALALTMRDMATVQEILIRNGVRTPNEGALAMGDAVHEEAKADKLYMNGKPLGQKDKPPQAPAPKPGNQPGDTDPNNTDGNGKEPAQAQEEEGRALIAKGAEVNIDDMWIASAVFQRAPNDKDDDDLVVFGVASTDSVDRENTIVNQESLGKALKRYIKSGNIFYNHNWMVAAGTAIEAEMRGNKMMLAARIGRDYNLVLKEGPLDSGVLYPINDLRESIKQGHTKGYSIAFRGNPVDGENEGDPAELFVDDLFEVSLCSIQANPDAEFAVMKAASNPLFVKMLRGESKPEPRSRIAWDSGLVPAAKTAATRTTGSNAFELDTSGDEELLATLDKELDKWL
jgi:HK97 family phage portal protein